MDKLVTALSKNREVRIYFADTTQAVRKGQQGKTDFNAHVRHRLCRLLYCHGDDGHDEQD